MEKSYCKPIMHLTPDATGTEPQSWAALTDDALRSIHTSIQEQEDAQLYRSNPDLIERQIENEWLLIPTGEMAKHLNGMVSLNATSHFIWERFQSPNSAGSIIAEAEQCFDDAQNLLRTEIREFVTTYAALRFLIPIDKVKDSGNRNI